MKKTLLLLLALCFALPVLAFDLEDVNEFIAFGFVAGGPAAITGGEVELGARVNNHTLGISVGVGVSQIINHGTLPIGLTYRLGRRHQLELGYQYVTINPTKSTVHALKIGYRVSFGPMYLNANFAPYVASYESGIKPWFGLGFGFYMHNPDVEPY